MTVETEMQSGLLPSARRPLTTAATLGLGAAARVIQGVSQEFRALTSATPLLIAVRQGSKTLRYEGRSLEVHAGDMVVLPAQRIILAHGAVVEHDAVRTFREAYAWLSLD